MYCHAFKNNNLKHNIDTKGAMQKSSSSGPWCPLEKMIFLRLKSHRCWMFIKYFDKVHCWHLFTLNTQLQAKVCGNKCTRDSAASEPKCRGTVQICADDICTNKLAVICKQLFWHYRLPGGDPQSTISVPPSYTVSHYQSTTQTRLLNVIAYRLLNASVIILTLSRLWHCFSCIWMTANSRLNGTSFNFNSSISNIICTGGHSFFIFLKMTIIFPSLPTSTLSFSLPFLFSHKSSVLFSYHPLASSIFNQFPPLSRKSVI